MHNSFQEYHMYKENKNATCFLLKFKGSTVLTSKLTTGSYCKSVKSQLFPADLV
jgi:hypothetical protein